MKKRKSGRQKDSERIASILHQAQGAIEELESDSLMEKFSGFVAVDLEASAYDVRRGFPEKVLAAAIKCFGGIESVDDDDRCEIHEQRDGYYLAVWIVD